MRVRYTPRARRDIDAILAHIAADDPEAAQRVGRTILKTIKMVGARPYLGIMGTRDPTTRSRLTYPYPYRVHYRLIGDEVWILHVRHTARRPWTAQ
jgi:toxin ParE1/3/4